MPIDRSKLPPGFLEALADTFEEGGKRVMKTVLREEPETFQELLESVLNKEEVILFGLDPTDEQLDWLAERIVAGIRSGTADEGKPFAKRMH